MLNQEAELQLALQAKAGDQTAFGVLYNSYIKRIYDFIYFKTLSKVTAEDLSSQVFLKALKHIANFKSDNFAAWLYTIARHTVIDHYRSDKNYKNIEDCWDLTDLSDLIKETDIKLKLEQVRSALQKLSANDRELLIMRLWSELSFQEIALSLGKKEAAVKVAFGRALNRLRQEISPLLLLIMLITIWKKIN